MAFWTKKINKVADLKEELNKKKKDEQKNQSIKRVDNLRIPQQLHIVMKSLGTQTEYSFITKDLSATGAFVVCESVDVYPFELQNTILECMVELNPFNLHEQIKLFFLAKIARVVAKKEISAAGFGIRIVQISSDYRRILENYIVRHGTPNTTMTPDIKKLKENM